MSDIYKDKWLRQWSISSLGEKECVLNALNLELISNANRIAIETKNEKIHKGITDVISYENALLISEPSEEITRTMRVYDEPTVDGETGETVEHWHMEPRPEWVAWDNAQEIIVNTSNELKALARLRKNEAEEGDLDIINSYWNYPIEVTELPDFPSLTPSQFWGVVYATGNDTIISDYLNELTLTDPMTAGLIRGRIEKSDVYLRYDPVTLAVQQWHGMTDTEFNALWIWAAGIQ